MKKVEQFPDPYVVPFSIFGERFLGGEEKRRGRWQNKVSSLELEEARKTRDVNRKLRLLQALKSTAKKKGSKYHLLHRLVFGFAKPKPKQIISQSPYSSLKQSLKPAQHEYRTCEAWKRMEIYYLRGGKLRPAPIVEDAKTFAKFFGRTAEQALFDTVAWYLLPSFRREVKNLFKKYRHFLVGDGNGN